MTRGRAIAATAAITVASLAGCGSDEQGADGAGDGGTVKIGVSISQTGPYAATASLLRNGYELGVEKLNADGGLLGRDVELIVKDDQSDPGTAVRAYTELFTEDQVDLALGPYSSVLGQPVAAVGEKYQRSIVHTFTTLSSVFADKRYNVQATYPSEAVFAAAPGLAKEAGLSRLAILTNSEEGQKAICDQAKVEAEAAGIELAFDGEYPSGTTDYSSLVVKAKQANPDAVILCSYLEEAIALTRGLNQQGLQPKLLAMAGAGQKEYPDAVKDLSDRVITNAIWNPQLETEGNEEFKRLYEQRFGEPATYHAAAGYAAIQLLAAAAQENDSVEPADVNQALHDITADTVLGTYEVDENAVQVGYPVYLVQWEDAELSIVAPPDAATGKLELPYR